MTELQTFISDISRCWESSQTPTEVRASFDAWMDDNKHHIARLRAIIAATAAWWIIKGAEDGHDQDILEQVALQQTQWAIAVIARAMKIRQGQTFEPARVAIVAYTVAKQVADDEVPVDLDFLTQTADAIVSDIEAENERLRKQIAEMRSGSY